MRQFAYGGIELEVDPGVFYPTETTKLILDSIRPLKFDGLDVLDLGCGCGVVAAVLGRTSVPRRLFASDLSAAATTNARRNLDRLGVTAAVRAGSQYEPWTDTRFDVVICDVSGVAADLARVSGWFGDSVPCASGRDGTALGLQIVKDTPRQLRPGGRLLMPVLTLSNHVRLKRELEAQFASVTPIAERQFYLSKDLMKHADLIEALHQEGAIEIEKKFGFYLWKTIVYQASI